MSTTTSSRRADLSSISSADESTKITAAQTGDPTALSDLFTAYAPAMNAAAARFRTRLDTDDAKQACAIGLMNAIKAFDPARPSGPQRLAVVVSQYLTEELWAAVADNGQIVIPARTLRRYFRIMREANGDLTRAEELAPKFEMRAATFAAVAVAVNPHLAYDAEVIDRPSASKYACVEDQILAKAALSAATEEQYAVLSMRYGFDGNGEVPLQEVGARLGLSRGKVNRLHADGLAAAREALGAL